MAVKRTRNFATVVYPESAPDNWFSVLEDSHVGAFISPLHDQDINPGGEIKKAHYHVILMYDSVKTREQAEEFIMSFGGVGCETINAIRGYARYLCHMDNPEKARYNTDDVIALGGADYFSTISLVVDKYEAIGDMMEYCEVNKVTSLAALMKYARINRSDWFRLLCDNSAFVMREYIKSQFWAMNNDEDMGCDDE